MYVAKHVTHQLQEFAWLRQCSLTQEFMFLMGFAFQHAFDLAHCRTKAQPIKATSVSLQAGRCNLWKQKSARASFPTSFVYHSSSLLLSLCFWLILFYVSCVLRGLSSSWPSQEYNLKIWRLLHTIHQHAALASMAAQKLTEPRQCVSKVL